MGFGGFVYNASCILDCEGEFLRWLLDLVDFWKRRWPKEGLR